MSPHGPQLPGATVVVLALLWLPLVDVCSISESSAGNIPLVALISSIGCDTALDVFVCCAVLSMLIMFPRCSTPGSGENRAPVVIAPGRAQEHACHDNMCAYLPVLSRIQKDSEGRKLGMLPQGPTWRGEAEGNGLQNDIIILYIEA